MVNVNIQVIYFQMEEGGGRIINVLSIQIYEFFNSRGVLQMLAESSAVFVTCLTCTQSSSRASGSVSPLFLFFSL